MASRIEQYGVIGDTQTAALVADDGSIDWLCTPRFDSGACFAALLGDKHNGRWLIAPAGRHRAKRRSYRDGTLVLETEFETADGAVRIIDFMPIRDKSVDIVRLVEGVRGRVPMHMELIVRFDYGSIVPWVRTMDGDLRVVAGPDALILRTPVTTAGENMTTAARFTVSEGDHVSFVLAWHPSHEPPPPPLDARQALAGTTRWWERWSARTTYEGDYRDAVNRSLITLKALTYAPTGGIVAAATTSLPERPGSVRNWDYRFCWLRDATFTLYALMSAGYVDEAHAWREWLLRAVAGAPEKLQIMYGPAGERRLTELEIPWLSGYEASTPVRVGNAASEQFQLDVYGEIGDALFQSRHAGLAGDQSGWDLSRKVLEFLEHAWEEPDEGIWEVRGPRQHFTHSKVMAWVAFDRAVKVIEEFGERGPLEHWRALRDEIHAEVCAKGYDADRGAFVQAYGSKHLDASLLMIPLVGFLPASDERVHGTVAAIERELTVDGFVLRYASGEVADGLPAGEGVFLPCSFWLADNLTLMGRTDEARAMFERLVGLANDVGLLAEEYDPLGKRQLWNFPQAFTHVGLVNSACNLASTAGPARRRAETHPHR
ncbi:MAG: glycoside hydrolase family 15 protein [Acidimicrobiia bacterium]